MVEKKRCAILGAGASGLPSTRWALAYGIEPVVFECTDSIGGLWRYKPYETELSSVMKSTIINTSKEMSAYSDFPPPAEFPNYMHNTEMMRYFQLYAEHHKLFEHIRFNHKIVQIRRAESFGKTGKWVVQFTVNDGEVREEEFDCVLLCHGHHAKPNCRWEWEGMSEFKGRILHAHSYKDHVGFEDSVNVVVGTGNSGGDLAVELSRVGKKVYWSTRRGTWVLAKIGDRGEPGDTQMNRFTMRYLYKKLPLNVVEWIVTQNLQKRLDHAKYGLMPKHSPLAQHPTGNDEIPNRIISGTVVVKPNIKKFTQNGVVWDDGSETEHVDNVVMATGYLFDFDMVEHGELLKVKDNVPTNLYKHFLPIGLKPRNGQGKAQHTIAVIGFVQPLLSILPIAELQARVFFEQFTGGLQLPSEEEMFLDIKLKWEAMRARFLNTLRHTIEVDFFDYIDELGDLIGCTPNPKDYILSDPRLAYAVMFGANVSYGFRLKGPHSWKGAREAVLNVRNRSDRALMTRDTGVTWTDPLPYIVYGLLVLFILYVLY